MNDAAATRAFSILSPLIEPEVSTTRATSSGARCTPGTRGVSTQSPT